MVLPSKLYYDVDSFDGEVGKVFGLNYYCSARIFFAKLDVPHKMVVFKNTFANSETFFVGDVRVNLYHQQIAWFAG